MSYAWMVPKLWNETIEAHRAAVRNATLDTAAALVASRGLRSVTMYKYFRDVEAILLAWHERLIAGHLEQLHQARERAGEAGKGLEAVLEAYALIRHESRRHHDTELAAFVHRDEQMARAQHQLRDTIGDLVTEAAAAGTVRADVAPA